MRKNINYKENKIRENGKIEKNIKRKRRRRKRMRKANKKIEGRRIVVSKS